MLAPDERRAALRDRQARYRERVEQGIIMITMAITPTETAKLAKLGYLTEYEVENREAVSEAIKALLADMLDA
jgi:hypothetical protein